LSMLCFDRVESKLIFAQIHRNRSRCRLSATEFLPRGLCLLFAFWDEGLAGVRVCGIRRRFHLHLFVRSICNFRIFHPDSYITSF